jgi:hypothetical protein
MPLYPLPPLLVAALAACIVASSLAESPLFVVLALCFVAAGLPVFWLAVDPSRPCHAAARHLAALCHARAGSCGGGGGRGGDGDSGEGGEERRALRTSATAVKPRMV